MSTAGGADDLQFQKAEFAGRKCAVCQSAIGAAYYQIQGRDACPTCAQLRLASQNAPDSRGKMLRAFLCGTGAAILGSAAFAIMALMGLRLAILSIGIGWLVGTAINKGTGGHTSRKYQVMAVLLTYLAIATSYIPPVLAQVAKQRSKAASLTSQIGQRQEDREKATAEPKPKRAVSAGSAGVALVIVTGMVVALPLIDAFGRLPMGLITLLIVFFGLQQAWKQTAPDDDLVAGPYQHAP